MHESILTSRSEYFKSALSFMWRSDPTKPVTLSDDDPNIFALYVNLAYTGHFATRGADEWVKLVRLYVLVEKLQDVRAQNDTIDAMHAFIREFSSEKLPLAPSIGVARSPLISPESIVELYDGTRAGSAARKLLLDSYAAVGSDEWIKAGRETLPGVFDLAASMMQNRTICIFNPVQQQTSSQYHVIAIEKSKPASDLIAESRKDGMTESFEARRKTLISLAVAAAAA